MQIDAVRAFLTMMWAGGADQDLTWATQHDLEPGIGNSFLGDEHAQQKTSAAATGSHSIHPWFVQLD
jgi:hypothetical protein